MKTYLAYINGQFVDSEKKVEIYSPETQKVIGTVPALKVKQIDDAFDAARKSFFKWAGMSPEVRSKWMLKFAEILKINANAIANLMVEEIAKNFNEAKVEVIRSVDYVVETVHAYDELISNPLTYTPAEHPEIPLDKLAVYYRLPLGVALTISPFNYPINLMVAKIIPALIMGNTVVHKSATQGSLVGAYVAQLFDQMHLDGEKFPAGVFNFVTGKGSEIGEYLITNKQIDVASFTGSTAVGIKLAKHMVMKPYVLELGGKDAALVLDDADLTKTVKEIIKGSYSYSGQRCTAIKRVFMTDKMADKLVPMLLEAVQKLTVGKAADNAQITALIDQHTINLLKHLYEDAVKKGAKALTGPLQIDKNLVSPVLLDHVTPEMEIAWTEPFSPILPIIRYQNVDDIIALMNKSEYGLQTSIFTENLNFDTRKIVVGTVNINRASSRGPDVLPFLGVKNSGFGEQGITSALKSFSRLQGVVYNDLKQDDK